MIGTKYVTDKILSKTPHLKSYTTSTLKCRHRFYLSVSLMLTDLIKTVNLSDTSTHFNWIKNYSYEDHTIT